MSLSLAPGTPVILHTPGDSPGEQRTHVAEGTVRLVTEWGAWVETQATETGMFRAHWSEMRVVQSQPAPSANGHPPAREMGYSGDPCQMCGSMRMMRNGACLCCQDCGATSGCS